MGREALRLAVARYVGYVAILLLFGLICSALYWAKGYKMETLTPSKVYENPYGESVLDCALVFHPPSNKYVAFWFAENASGLERIFAAVINDDDTLGTVTEVTTSTYRGIRLHKCIFYDDYSQKIIQIGTESSNDVGHFVYTITAGVVSQPDYYYTDALVGITPYAGSDFLHFGSGYVLSIDEGPRVFLWRTNPSTGQLVLQDSLALGALSFEEAPGLVQLSSNRFLAYSSDWTGSADRIMGKVVTNTGGTLSSGSWQELIADNGTPYDSGATQIDTDLAAISLEAKSGGNWGYINTIIVSAAVDTLTVEETHTYRRDTGGAEGVQLIYDANNEYLVLGSGSQVEKDYEVLVYDLNLDIVDTFAVFDATVVTDGGVGYAADGLHVALDADNDRYLAIAPMELDDPADIDHLYLGGVGSITPLFWTNHSGQKETQN